MPVFCSVPRQDIAASLYELAACRLLFRSVKDGKAYYSNDEMDGEWCNSMSRYLAQHIYNMRKASFDFGNGITVTSHGSGKSELVCEGLRREVEEPFIQVYEYAKKAVQAYNNNQPALAEEYLQQLSDTSNVLVEKLRALQKIFIEKKERFQEYH